MKDVMSCISRLSQECGDYIGEVFTIYSCKREILNTTNSDFEKSWNENEGTLSNVDIMLRDSNHKELKEKTLIIENSYSEYIKEHSDDNTGFRRSTILGQDDVIIAFKNIPLDFFLDMYREKEGGNNGALVGCKSRTVIELVLSECSPSIEREVKKLEDSEGFLINPECGKTVNGDNALTQSMLSLQAAFKKVYNTEKKRLFWMTPLFELLTELANIEVSATAYDIYAQAIDSQIMLVKQLEIMINDDNKRAILMMPDSATVYFIQRYIQGWSQLSFHAMHSEWQLTQTAEINRLYLFPAKLNRLYASFMKNASRILSAEDNACATRASSIKSKTNTCYFLTPKVCSDAEFISIFRETNNVTSLILGEIPADLLFSPHILMPTLIHETAHYVGGVIRMREERCYFLLECCMEYILSRMINNDLLYHEGTDGIPLIYKLVQKWRSKLNSSPGSFYGEDVVQWIKKVLDPSELQKKDFFFEIALYAVSLHKDYGIEDRPNQVIHAKRMINDQNYDKLFDGKHEEDLEFFISQLITIYREAFCDICMIEILGLECADYLNVLCRINRYNGRLNQNDIESVHEMINFERYIGVIEAKWCDNVGRIGKSNTSWLFKNRSHLSANEERTAMYLLNILRDIDCNTGSMSIRMGRFLHAYLKTYLQNVSEKIHDLFRNDDILSQFRDEMRIVYDGMSNVIWEKKSTHRFEYLEACLKMMKREIC